MTGGAFRAMKFTKAALALLMMIVMTGSGQAATATLTINVTSTQPSCNVTVPSSYMLEALVPGEMGKAHPPLKITWSCEGNTPLKTALTAAIVSGDSEGDGKVHLVTDSRQRTGVTLSLREKTSGNLIKLTGKENFCGDTEGTTGMRTCTLTPVTDVSHGSGRGNASATLRFEVRYV
ncbi:F18 fimbrial protein FedE [Escherichia albertii]|nr:F18 fimbrial protein FedE [Escherichia albertii]HAY5217067.1 F18 fimbrial protein FedE [Escherichia coli]EEW4360106.1 F18 fimbrial protein FedE [Escherichia albertii]EEW7553152.1 F18 fimbrial protein FedE [Escherichia albertii]EEX4924359.1 F18 fimbrial protein FedE [Escherichia albertii]